jgi:hypothetical protein
MPALSVEHSLPIDVRRLVKAGGRAGVVQCGSSSLGYELDLARLRLSLHWTSQGRPFVYVMKLSETRPYYGGLRWWAQCPRCQRRCAVLNILGGVELGCRVCLQLAYGCTRETAFALACRRVRRIRLRLGASGDLLAPLPKKPRGMHWRTFFELAEKEHLALGQVIQEMDRMAACLEELVARTSNAADRARCQTEVRG